MIGPGYLNIERTIQYHHNNGGGIGADPGINRDVVLSEQDLDARAEIARNCRPTIIPTIRRMPSDPAFGSSEYEPPVQLRDIKL